MPLSCAGLYEPGWHPIYRPLFHLDLESICGDWVQQVGNDHLHSVRYTPQRSCAEEEKTVRKGILTFSLHPQLAVNVFGTVVNLLTPTTKRCPHLGCAPK